MCTDRIPAAMRFISTEVTQIDIEDGEAANANPKEAAMQILRRSEGYCIRRAKLISVREVKSVGAIVGAYELRKGAPGWRCTVVYEAEWMAVHSGESQLFTFDPKATLDTMGNAHCIGYNSAMELVSYDKADVVPMTVVDVYMHPGVEKFSCTLVPWMANVQRAPIYFEGGVNDVEKEQLETLREKIKGLAEVREQVAGLPSALKALDLMTKRKKPGEPSDDEMTIEDALDRVLGEGEFPPSSLALNLGKGTCLWSSGVEIPRESAIARASDVLNILYIRELSLLEIVLELGKFHSARLEKGKQDNVWMIASRAQPNK